MFTGSEIAELLTGMGVSHVVWLPDSTLGQWEQALEACDALRLIRVCREGEAWAIAAGLHLAGQNPLVMIQCTGLFESGDALRNVVYDYRLPLFALVGYRSYLNESTLPGDTARIYAEPVLDAWGLDYRLIEKPEQRDGIRAHYDRCREAQRPGVVLLAEGKA